MTPTLTQIRAALQNLAAQRGKGKVQRVVGEMI